ncbi:SPOR domain-containing protein [Thiomicrorhabdus sp. ZW0627]|uniref:SPOR domain-containing protein n=1 Tax=Thiomicrorhabdus sp. ZW0627 TaxID=3039774 RepID=UPI0024364F38|nr:SPOR domain-containing protein [Thiomicrorhabdus sp. ZW0627]MDG6772922.1 SPOR domain-containing protein [Thiomicrorhabdus sp. ZW0627]
MAQTISELEKERAELLKAIESQAQNISSQRSSDINNESGHSLHDWLNAAEEVMPSTKSSSNSTKATSSSHSTKTKPTPNKTSFFGIIILLTLLLTILGVLYIAYTTINKELQSVIEIKEKGQAETQQLQKSMDELQQKLVTGGKPEMFTALEQRVVDLEKQLDDIQQQQQALIARLEAMPSSSVAASAKSGVASEEGSEQVELTRPATETDQSKVMQTMVSEDGDKVVTESILEEKLKTYTSKLEERIDQKLEVILQHLTKGDDKIDLSDQVLLKPDEVKAPEAEVVPDEKIEQPNEPETPSLDVPRIEQPIVKLVDEIAEPKPAEIDTKSLEAHSSDEKWLLEQPAQHYTLQLASMVEKETLEGMVRQKGLMDTRIVLQKRGDNQRYVLVTGSYAKKSDADKLAKEIKSEFGISPWVRKVKDLTSKLP